MPFTRRNARYLRISAHIVLPLYIYLDDKHVEWMTDCMNKFALSPSQLLKACSDARAWLDTLQRVLEDLRPLIGPKLQAENNLHNSGGASAKKATVDVHRGDTYQFAYFFRKNEPHAVLIKSRNFVRSSPPVQTPQTSVVEPQQPSGPKSRKHNGVKSKPSSTKSVSKTHSRSKKRAKISDSDENEALEENGDEAISESAQERTASRTLRKRKVVKGGYRETDGDGYGYGDDIAMVDSDYNPMEVEQDPEEDVVRDKSPATAPNVQDDTIAPDPEPNLSSVFDLDADDEEEEKPKLSMKVTYQGFTIYDRCLCLIIEPWPPLRNKSRMRSVVPSLARHSENPTESREGTPAVSIRARTPLFLPDLDPRRSTTPASPPSRLQVPLFDHSDNAEPEDQGESSDEGGMMAFSQVLKSAGDERAGSADEDENEGDVFLGDADERRGDP